MLDVTPFDPADLAGLPLQPQQIAEMEKLGDWRAMGAKLQAAGPAWTGRWNGQVIMCAGLGVHWPGRAEAWAFVGAGFPRRLWPAIHRRVQQHIEDGARALDLRRLEASCAYGFAPGKRWLEMLGFGEAHLARFYGPDGRDYWRMARVFA